MDGEDIDTVNTAVYYESRLENDKYMDAEDVGRVLNEAPPKSILGDLRYKLGVRSIWVAAEGRHNDVTGIKDAFVVIFRSLHCSDQTCERALSLIENEYQEIGDGCQIDRELSEDIELKEAIRFVHDQGYLAWIVTEHGEIIQYDGRFKSKVANISFC